MSQFFTVMKHFNIVCGDTRFAVLMNQLSTNKNRTPLGGGQPSQTWIGLSVSGASTPLSFLLGRSVGGWLRRRRRIHTLAHMHACHAHAMPPTVTDCLSSGADLFFDGAKRRQRASASAGTNKGKEGRKKEGRPTGMDGRDSGERNDAAHE